jgi:polar amino acid transport system substrate-binding protein
MAKRANIDLKFLDVPFKRALAMTEIGSADIMLGPNRTSAREQYMLYLKQEPPRERKKFYLRPEVPDIVIYEDLIDLTVAVLRGAVYFKRFDNDETQPKEKINTYKSGLQMVVLNRLDSVIVPELLGDHLVRKLGLSLKKATFSHEGRPSYIAVSKKSSLVQKKRLPQLNFAPDER